MAITLKCELTEKVLKEDWHLVNLDKSINPREIGTWCHDNFGPMLGNIAIFGRWFGSYYEIKGVKYFYIAFRDEEDYLVYTLKWS